MPVSKAIPVVGMADLPTASGKHTQYATRFTAWRGSSRETEVCTITHSSRAHAERHRDSIRAEQQQFGITPDAEMVSRTVVLGEWKPEADRG